MHRCHAARTVAVPLQITRPTSSGADEYGEVKLPLGYFANVVDIGHGIGIAVTTDGVGTKILIAQMLQKYDTIGIDCVGMNVNDIRCVGVEPIRRLSVMRT